MIDEGEGEDAAQLSRRASCELACGLQLLLSAGLMAVAIAQRGRGFPLLTLQPFFIGAAILGYIGARYNRPAFVFSHAIGSSGLSLVFALFIFASTFLQPQDKPDLWILVINLPMDVYLLVASLLSLRLGLAMRRVRRALKKERERLRAQIERAEGGGVGIAEGVVGARHGLLGDTAERKLQASQGGTSEASSQAVSKDVCCPISMAVMCDPVSSLLALPTMLPIPQRTAPNFCR